jgi:formate-dependent nitrite reductase membrane component NrfD
MERAAPDLVPQSAPEAGSPTYYGLPVLKEPVWTWEIPTYFFTGGLAGACALLGGATQLAGGRRVGHFVRRARLVAAGGAAASAVLLIADLGRPGRFLAMLRVFRPSSPMNQGTWVLSSFGACSAAAALGSFLPLPRPLRRAADLAGIGAAILGLPLVGYTGVLLANTAVPVWQATRNTLPVLFAFSGMVSAAAVFDLWPVPGPGTRIARRLGLVSRGAEFALSNALHREAGVVPRVEDALRRGPGGLLLRAARIGLLAASLLDVVPGARSRSRRRIIGALGILGTLAIRFGVIAAGRASARDPRATFDMQRAGRGAAEIAKERRHPMPAPPGVDVGGRESYGHGAPST